MCTLGLPLMSRLFVNYTPVVGRCSDGTDDVAATCNQCVRLASNTKRRTRCSVIAGTFMCSLPTLAPHCKAGGSIYGPSCLQSGMTTITLTWLWACPCRKMAGALRHKKVCLVRGGTPAARAKGALFAVCHPATSASLVCDLKLPRTNL